MANTVPFSQAFSHFFQPPFLGIFALHKLISYFPIFLPSWPACLANSPVCLPAQSVHWLALAVIVSCQQTQDRHRQKRAQKVAMTALTNTTRIAHILCEITAFHMIFILFIFSLINHSFYYHFILTLTLQVDSSTIFFH